MNKLFLASALASSLILTGCGSSSSDTANNAVNNATSAISGTITDDSNTTTPNALLPGVMVECIYTGSLPCSSNSTDTSGNYSVTVLNSTDFYLRASKSSYITLNSAVLNVSANDTGNDLGLIDASDATDLLTAAFSDNTLTLSSAAWLVVDVVDTTGSRITGKVVTASVAADTAVYPDCATAQPTSPVATATTDCTGVADPVPAYMAKYSTPSEVTVTVGSQTQRGFLATGEVLYMEFEQ